MNTLSPKIPLFLSLLAFSGAGCFGKITDEPGLAAPAAGGDGGHTSSGTAGQAGSGGLSAGGQGVGATGGIAGAAQGGAGTTQGGAGTTQGKGGGGAGPGGSGIGGGGTAQGGAGATQGGAGVSQGGAGTQQGGAGVPQGGAGTAQGGAGTAQGGAGQGGAGIGGAGTSAKEDTSALCADHLDNDANGQIDCADPGCIAFCGAGGSPGAENTAELCADGLDNDGDGLIDCEDSGCCASVECDTQPTSYCVINAAKLADCNPPANSPSQGSCIVLSEQVMCNAVTNAPCMADEACDRAGAGALACYSPPNDAVSCGACDNNTGPFCGGGFTCRNKVCVKFCCEDGDCSAGALCDHSISTQIGGVCLKHGPGI